MKKHYLIVLFLSLSSLLCSCATVPHDRYNTQRGAAIGAGVGAIIGHGIGGNTEGTLVGLAAGTMIGALVGNAADQDYQALRDEDRYSPSPPPHYYRRGRTVAPKTSIYFGRSYYHSYPRYHHRWRHHGRHHR